MKSNNFLKTYLIVYLGCFLQAFAVNVVLKPNNLTVGGFTGLSLALEDLAGIRFSLIYYMLCLTTLIMAFRFLGREAGLKIIILSLTYPLLLLIFDFFNFFTILLEDKLLACICYGVTAGTGMGLVLREGFSQGSSDTIARIVKKLLLPHISLGNVLLGIDILVLLISGAVFGREAVLYALVMQVVYAKVVDSILLWSGDPLVKVTVITYRTDEVKEYIREVLHRGVSIGNNTDDFNSIQLKLISICSAKEAHAIKEHVAKLDREAFINMVPVMSVWGKGSGFQPLNQTKNNTK